MTAGLSQEVFGSGGLLERAYPGYELRPGQIRMSLAVEEAIAGPHHLLMEAPTGIGKTFAYMVPAIASGRRVVVSTGTKNLQEQLFFKDIPMLERVLGREVTAACMKGRDNYLCIKRFRDFEMQPVFEDIDESGFNERLARWSRTTTTGDRSELDDMPERLRLWDRISARADTCLGQRCPDYEPCHLTQMRRRAASSQIVVVNHHLLMADMVLKDHAFGQVIPDYAVLILDEAHVLEDVATAHLGRAISQHMISEIADEMDRTIQDPDVSRRSGALRIAASEFFGLARPDARAARAGAGVPPEGRFPLESLRHDALWNERGRTLREALSLCESTLRQKADPFETATTNLPARTGECAETLEMILEAGDDPDSVGSAAVGMVTWGEARGRNVILQAAPIDVSAALRQMLFSRVPAVVLTSATLAIDGTFDFVKGRLGVREGAQELVLDSPFDLEHQAVLYVPRAFPEPRHESFIQRFVEEVRVLLSISSGRAFLLFTSYANLRRVREALEGTLPWPLMAQGDEARHKLLERFRASRNAVLLATSSFWHGVDVQGEALSLVVIDKLPFDVPNDPVVSARIESIRRAQGKPFVDYQVPAAVIDLKQGLGRLIRSRQDRGILAVMDGRLLTRPYGRIFLNSIPPYRLVHELDDVRRFFASTN